MDDEVSALTANLNASNAVDEEAIARLERLAVLPKDYLRYMRHKNGGDGMVGASYLSLWPAHEIPALNEAYGVGIYAPGLLLFGSDGGDTAYAFDTRMIPAAIAAVPFVGMSLDETTILGRHFLEFLERLTL